MLALKPAWRDRILRPFAEVHPGEGLNALLLTLTVHRRSRREARAAESPADTGPPLDRRGAFYADYFTWVNAVTALSGTRARERIAIGVSS